mgnify:CR=1 FL=1
MNFEKIYSILIEILEKQENVKIKVDIERKWWTDEKVKRTYFRDKHNLDAICSLLLMWHYRKFFRIGGKNMFVDINGKEILEEEINLLFDYEDFLKASILNGHAGKRALEHLRNDTYKKIYVVPTAN